MSKPHIADFQYKAPDLNRFNSIEELNTEVAEMKRNDENHFKNTDHIAIEYFQKYRSCQMWIDNWVGHEDILSKLIDAAELELGMDVLDLGCGIGE